MKKVYILIQSTGEGSVERIAYYLFSKLNFEKVITLSMSDNPYGFPEDRVLTIHTTHKNLLGKFQKWYRWYSTIKTIKRNTDICISFYEPANLINVLTKQRELTILSFHNHYTLAFNDVKYSSIYGRLKRSVYRFLIKKLYNRADIFHSVSYGIKSDLVKNFGLAPEKFVIIYNPLDIESIEQLKEEQLGAYESIFEKPVIITAGRLTFQKGQWYLLRVFKYLKKDLPDLRLVILGEGELKDYLVNLSENLGLKTYVWDRDTLSDDYDVYFLGFQKNPFKFIARAKLFVFPSLWEGLGNVIIEAMACGVPVVSSDCRSGPREILAPDTDLEYQTLKPEFVKYGVLMPNFSLGLRSTSDPIDNVEKEWIVTIIDLLNDQESLEYFSLKGKERASHFDKNKIIEEWKRFFENYI